MAFTYTTQEAGWALTVEQFGDPGTVSQLYTITRTSELPQIDLALYYEDGFVAYTVTVDPAGTSYSPTPVFLGETSRLVTRLVVTTAAGPTTVLDCEWTSANTGQNLCGLDDCLAYYLPSNIDGHGLDPADGTVFEYVRDLSGNENTLIVDKQGTIADATYEDAYFPNGGSALYFPVLVAGVTASFQHSEHWTAYVYTQRGTLVSAVVDYILNSGSQAGQLQNSYTGGGADRLAQADAFNTTPFANFTASGPTMDMTAEHLFVTVHAAGLMSIFVDDMTSAVATVALTGTGASRSDKGLAVNAALGGAANVEGWFGGVALFGVAHDEATRVSVGRGISQSGTPVNLAPAPGGVLTATASPRGRVRIGMSVSPDGGAP